MQSEQRLFEAAKIGVFVDGYFPNVEKRKGGEVSVLTVRMRVQPFDSKLAAALDDGVGGDSNIRATVFSLNTGDPKPNFTRHDFKLGVERQNLELFASPDTEVSRIVLLQVKITGTYVRSQKDMNALAFAFKATFGPVSKTELEAIHALHRMQTFVTFHTAEPLLDMEDDGADDTDDEDLTDADEKARQAALPAPMFDDPRDVAPEPPTVREKGARRKMHSHQGKKKTTRKRSDARA